ncbi:hypothetical protein [Paenibacillus spongiae]|uniref:ABC transporter permease n=1 Tax=Paenibacillus spongiae TaxID=2909671 RepID=A0ABY5S637_9BACL|nr:hypothetical protein [Paenibacillus spongiae]UVI29381.1 hypothetical protein L1F29_28820 [Paenibacillus spongiae]
MSQPKPGLQRFVRLWWVQLPFRASRLSKKLPYTFLDGLYLAAWPTVAAWAPLLTLFIGLVIGWWHPGFESVFSESLVVIMIAAIVGTSSANLGLLFLAGFIFGDFFLQHTSWTEVGWRRNEGLFEHVIKVRIPLVIEYGLLYILVVKIPMITKALTAQLRVPFLPLKTSFKIAAALYVLITGILVYFWTQTVPVLIRPVFTWISSSPPAQATVPLQQYEWVIIFVAIVIAAIRMLLQGMTAFRSEIGKPLDGLERELRELPPVESLGDRLNPWFSTAAVALWSVLMIAGVYKSWIDPVFIGALIFVLLAIRQQLIPIPLGVWAKWMDKIPLLIRLVIGFILIKIIASAILENMMYATDTFRPLLLMTALSMLIIFLLTPQLPVVQPKEGEPSK